MPAFDLAKLTREEREILIRKSDAADNFDLVTTSPIWKARLEKLGWPLKPDHQGGWSCLLPENAITIRCFKAVNLSPEERTKRAAGLKAYRERNQF